MLCFLTFDANPSKVRLLLFQYLCQTHDLISLKANAQCLVCAVSSTSHPHCHYGPISSKVPVYGRHISSSGSPSHVPHSLHSSLDVDLGHILLPKHVSLISLTSLWSTSRCGKGTCPMHYMTSSTTPEVSPVAVIHVLEAD